MCRGSMRCTRRRPSISARAASSPWKAAPTYSERVSASHSSAAEKERAPPATLSASVGSALSASASGRLVDTYSTSPKSCASPSSPTYGANMGTYIAPGASSAHLAASSARPGSMSPSTQLTSEPSAALPSPPPPEAAPDEYGSARAAGKGTCMAHGAPTPARRRAARSAHTGQAGVPSTTGSMKPRKSSCELEMHSRSSSPSLSRRNRQILSTSAVLTRVRDVTTRSHRSDSSMPSFDIIETRRATSRIALSRCCTSTVVAPVGTSARSSLGADTVGREDTSATLSDEQWLPMVHGPAGPR